MSAKSLTAKSTKIIGVIVPLGEGDYNFFKDPYLSELIGVVEHSLRKKGYYAMIRSVNLASDISTLLKTWNMDGAIFLLPYYEKIVQKIIGSNDLPMVFLDSYSDCPDMLSVCINDYKGGYIATKYLINMGHRNIAFAGPIEPGITEGVVSQRFKGYQSALCDSNIEYREDFVFPAMSIYDMGVLIGHDIADRKGEITAVFSTADIMVGFDNIEAAIFSTPKLTTISQNISWKAEFAIEQLMNQIDYGSVDQKRTVLDVELIERQSVVPRVNV